MKIKIANLTEESLQDAPEWDGYPFSCKYCLYWEFPGESTGPIEQSKDKAIRMKTAWLQRTNEHFGNCGKIAYVDGVAEGYAHYAPPGFFPRVAEYQAGPPSQEAVLISCLFIPRHRFRKLGLGSQLLDNVLAELKQRGIGAVETFARKGKADNPSGPAEFYFRNGFRIYRDDAEYPLLRLVL
ncbi:GCN5-related N-acetyltransferase [uncultured spirochete]|jgi:GNAT superfamily N-acetyltransferase|uniref:GCN5-related N-acetyltransferase n=1 Tax=uncultured spirochete TaxID=156406 RepID=A0A3P3XJ98_9SPIR|nr:GNAT family N-acetyltransferase [Rectinema subterraneum]SLM13598.1 GCN5-related N-acetyltransferase [uncultured spirochete]